MLASQVHPFTFEPLLPVGWRRDGRPIWPVLGGNGDSGGDGGGAGSGGGSGSGASGTDSGDSGGGGDGDQDGNDPVKLKEALRKEREQRRDAERRAKAGETAQGELDKLRAGAESETDKRVKQAREEAANETRAAMTKERVLDKIEVAAAGKFADVEDARLHLGKHADDYVDKNGQIDTKAISKAVDELLEDKPHLKAATAGGGKPKAKPSHDQGTRSDDKATAKEKARAEAERRFPKQFAKQ